MNASAFITGNELADICGIRNNTPKSEEFCLGYISGVLDAEELAIINRIRVGQVTQEELKLIDLNIELARKQLKIIDQLAPFQVRLIGRSLAEHGLDPKDRRSNVPRSILTLKACLPHYATRQQLADVVTKYLRDNPAERHQPAQFLVLEALATAFPCN
ncbi:MAG: hypothetical protein A2W68_08690 [Betaproteobacteria bacterium RIFCSPLOWO2_02_64_14]|nr:MAG: hypothetical protein A2W68_08690 [Betaproteobacteria bacterium RIFCSPLOWO2_02_64_14]